MGYECRAILSPYIPTYAKGIRHMNSNKIAGAQNGKIVCHFHGIRKGREGLLDRSGYRPKKAGVYGVYIMLTEQTSHRKPRCCS